MAIRRYRHSMGEIFDAIQYNVENCTYIHTEIMGHQTHIGGTTCGTGTITLPGGVIIQAGNWAVRGPNGTWANLNASLFDQFYKLVEEDSPIELPTCDSCIHWLKRSNEGLPPVVYAAGPQEGVQAPGEWGSCGLVESFGPVSSEDRFFVIDDSYMYAALVVRSDFTCIMHETDEGEKVDVG